MNRRNPLLSTLGALCGCSLLVVAGCANPNSDGGTGGKGVGGGQQPGTGGMGVGGQPGTGGMGIGGGGGKPPGIGGSGMGGMGTAGVNGGMGGGTAGVNGRSCPVASPDVISDFE